MKQQTDKKVKVETKERIDPDFQRVDSTPAVSAFLSKYWQGE